MLYFKSGYDFPAGNNGDAGMIDTIERNDRHIRKIYMETTVYTCGSICPKQK